MQDQDEFITRNANFEDVVSEANDRAILEDIGCNADLYIANQEDVTQSEMFGQCSAGLSLKLSKLQIA